MSRLIAVMRLYGGFTSGKPCTVRFAESTSAIATAGPPPSAPEPPLVRAPDSTVPWWYGMSDAPGGGGTRPSVAIEVCDAT